MGSFDPGAFSTAFDTSGSGIAIGQATAYGAGFQPLSMGTGVAEATAAAYGVTSTLAPVQAFYVIHAVRTQFLGGQVRRSYVEFGSIAPSSARATRTLIARQ